MGEGNRGDELGRMDRGEQDGTLSLASNLHQSHPDQ
ncbi:hypothetical protein NC652_016953 [Populus alba x Populus x berolinensis]|nr:hypothetical protein NC652_016953 [Populus alba x Populus x berolinensis]